MKYLARLDYRSSSIVGADTNPLPEYTDILYVSNLGESVISKLIHESFVFLIRNERTFVLFWRTWLLQVQTAFIDGCCTT